MSPTLTWSFSLLRCSRLSRRKNTTLLNRKEQKQKQKTKGGCKRKSDRIKKNELLLRNEELNKNERTELEKQLALDRYMRAGDGARKKDRKQSQRLHIKGFAKALPVKAPPPLKASSPPPFKASSPPFKAKPISARAVALLPMSSMDMMDDSAAPYCGHDES